MIGGKWKPVILFCISNGVDRFGAMQRAVPGITKQMLTKQLRELEADGLISRTVYAEVPPRVDYALTDKGRSILPVVEEMRHWGATYLKDS
jgi:DNA-binding HxlR family transcriptional regulator